MSPIEQELVDHLEHFRLTSNLAARVAAIVARGALILHPDWNRPEQRAEWAKLSGELRDHAESMDLAGEWERRQRKA